METRSRRAAATSRAGRATHSGSVAGLAPRRSTRLSGTSVMGASVARAVMTVELCPRSVKRPKLETPEEPAVPLSHEATLAMREAAIAARERVLDAENEKLKHERARVRRQETEARKMLEQAQKQMAVGMLSSVEDKFTCPLCLELIACPYILNPPVCGHTFCAECILKWYFSVLHDECGCWHENVTCPTCRGALPYTKYEVPRPTSLIPFTPNRTLDKFMNDFMEQLSKSDLPEYGRTGKQYKDWKQRNDNGRNVMRDLNARWENLKAPDFLTMKRHFGL